MDFVAIAVEDMLFFPIEWISSEKKMFLIELVFHHINEVQSSHQHND